VYIVNTASSTTPAIVPLNISSAAAAAFSPDGLKTLVVGGTGATSLYVYSSLQALQGPIALSGAANSVAFSPNGGFAYVAEAANGAASANVTAYASCNNQVAATVPLTANPILMQVLPNVHLDGKDSYGNSIPDGVHVLVLDATGFDILTSTVSPPATGTLCPQGLTFISGDPLRPAQRIELGQGTLQPVNFFASADGSQLYVVNSSSSTIFVYNFLVGSLIGGIPLLNNATPINATMSVGAGTILIAGSDGMLHEITTSAGGSDQVQLAFPNIPNYLDAFCTYSPTSGPCALDVALTKP
jgi:DNA-binding beta-propeller fold protein YncE